MPVKSQWDNADKTIIRNDFEGNWTWEEYFEMIEQRNALMSSVDHRVDVIANMRPANMPTSGGALSSAKLSLSNVPPNHGIFVIVINTMVGTMLDIFKLFDRQTGISLHAAKSLEEAREIISQERAKNAGGNQV